jgi:hypothetical protein
MNEIRERIAELHADLKQDGYWTFGEYWRDSQELRRLLRTGGGPRRFCRTDPRWRRWRRR